MFGTNFGMLTAKRCLKGLSDLNLSRDTTGSCRCTSEQRSVPTGSRIGRTLGGAMGSTLGIRGGWMAMAMAMTSAGPDVVREIRQSPR